MSSELALLKNFAATARRGGFGPPGFRLDGTTGEYHRVANKTGAKMNGQRLAATVADVMVGWQKIEKGKPPIYIVGRVSDGYTPPDREELGDTDHEKDPWAAASWLPFWDPETREVLLFHAPNDGSRNAVANLTEAYVDYREAHPDQLNYDPLTNLALIITTVSTGGFISRSSTSSTGSSGRLRSGESCRRRSNRWIWRRCRHPHQHQHRQSRQSSQPDHPVWTMRFHSLRNGADETRRSHANERT